MYKRQGLDKVLSIFGMPGYVSVDYSYTGDRYTSQANDLKLPSYAIANMRVGVESGNRSMEVFISNLTDENGYQSRYDDFGDIRRTQNRPKVIGLRFKYRY